MAGDEQLDRLILSLATQRWQKTAMIIAQAVHQLESEHAQHALDDPRGKVAERIEHLVDVRRLEVRGDLSRWRHSEVRLPNPAR